MPTVEAYLAQIIQPLLNKPELASIAKSADDMGILLTVKVDSSDMGPIVGKLGETAKAIRHLVRIAGVKQNMRVNVKISEPDGSAYRPRPKEVPQDLIT